MSSVPPRRNKVLTVLKLIVLGFTIIAGTSIAYMMASSNAGMLNCPLGWTKIGNVCFDRSCGLIVLWILGGLLLLFAVISLICALINRDNESQRRACWMILENVIFAILSLMWLMFGLLCTSWP